VELIVEHEHFQQFNWNRLISIAKWRVYENAQQICVVQGNNLDKSPLVRKSGFINRLFRQTNFSHLLKDGDLLYKRLWMKP
jgi:hypothetical protein